MHQFSRDRVSMLALGWIALIGAVAVLGVFWTPFGPNEQFTGDPFSGISKRNWLGTDDLGRDVLSRLMVGAGVSLRVSLIVVGAAVVISIPLGLFAGYRGGYTDTVLMRVLDAVTSVPGIVSALAIVGVMGPGLNNVMVALVVILIPHYVRLIRAQSLSVAAESFVTASRSVGTRTPRILLTRVLPGVVPALSVQVSLGLGAALTAEAALSFLGLGVVPPNASWGGVLSRAYRNILRDPNGLIAPMVAIGTVVLAFNLVGDGLRDALGAGRSRSARKRAKLGITTVARGPEHRRSSSRNPVAVVPEHCDHSESDRPPRLVVDGLCVEFHTNAGAVQALDAVSLHVGVGEVLGIVGESGSGKTVTAMSIMRLLASPPAVITAGSIRYEGAELLDLSVPRMREVRGGKIAMVFQNPMTSFDPVFTIGNSLRESIRSHRPMSKRAADRRAVELLDLVGIPSPASRLNDYPHNFSGGMRQRAMIAMALAGEPKLLIADEPTTALDVTIQAQVLDLLNALRIELGMSMILVTHDLGVVAEICDRVSVMYAGHVVETAPVEQLFADPKHPYTAGLLAAVPSATGTGRRLTALPGIVPTLGEMPVGCRFAPRCPHAVGACASGPPPLTFVEGHEVRCIRAAELELGRHDGS